MASGDTLFERTAIQGVPSTSVPAVLTKRQDHWVASFQPGTADMSYDWAGRLANAYDGNGLDVEIGWIAESATTGNVVWTAQIERQELDSANFDADTESFATANSVTDAAPAASGNKTDAIISFTNGVDMDSLAAGEGFRIRIARDQNNASDNMAGDAQILDIHIVESTP